MLRDEVLALLKAREGKPLSGEEMSRALGVSRAAVWKAMESLRDEGYVISSAPRRGYALEGSPDRLSAGELAGALAGRRVGRALVCLETVDSTNNEVKRRALAGAADGLAVVAEQQTGGRGRRGRSFVSPAGQGLYLSVLLRPRCPLEEVSTLTAWTAVAVCNAVERVCGVRPGIKWPNDVINCRARGALPSGRRRIQRAGRRALALRSRSPPRSIHGLPLRLVPVGVDEHQLGKDAALHQRERDAGAYKTTADDGRLLNVIQPACLLWKPVCPLSFPLLYYIIPICFSSIYFHYRCRRPAR